MPIEVPIDFVTILVAFGFILLGAAVVLWMSNRTDSAKVAGGIGAIFIAAILVGTFGGFLTATGLPGDGVPASCDKTLSVTTLKMQAKTRFKESWTDTDLNFDFYESDADPGAANVTALASLAMIDGNGTYTGQLLKTCTAYRIVASNDPGFYTEDFGVRVIDLAQFSEETGTAVVNVTTEWGVQPTTVASIDTLVDFSASGSAFGYGANSFDSNTVGNDANELRYCTGSVCGSGTTLTYDESDGDGTFKFEINPGASGANAAIKEPVLCFEFDATNPPEANEISAMEIDHRSGNVFDGLSGDLANVWQTESCVALGGELKGGTSGEYWITVTVSESALDSTDDWFIIMDDLGDNLGRDVLNKKSATRSRGKFASQA